MVLLISLVFAPKSDTEILASSNITPENDTEEAIHKLNNNLSSGTDQVLSFLLKDCASVLIKPF